MNETMLFLDTQANKVLRVSNKIKKLLIANDEHIVFHPTVITNELINDFKDSTSESDVLEISNVFRITKDIPGTPVLYFVVVQKRYGKTYKPKYFYLLNRDMYALTIHNFSDRIIDIATFVAQEINFRL